MRYSCSNISDIAVNNFRLDAGPYASDGYVVRQKIAAIKSKKEKLGSLTLDGINGIYHVGQDKLQRVTSPDEGVCFLRSSDIMRADISSVSLVSKSQVNENPLFTCPQYTTLITRSGTIGNMAFARSAIAKCAISQDVLKVVPDPVRVREGYLYAYLASSYGVPQIKSGTFGSIIVHIEAEDICDIEVPRFAEEFENKIDNLVKDASHLRDEYESKSELATNLLFESANIPNITAFEWHSQGIDSGFEVTLTNSRSLRPLNFNSRYKQIIERLKSANFKTLGDICEGGTLSRGGRFIRVDASPEHGIQLLGQKQGFWTKPEGRWLAEKYAKNEVIMPNESIVLAGLGTLGEREVFCRPVFVQGNWTKFGYSENFLRIIRTDPEISGAYLFAFLRSETAFRCIRSICAGSKQHYIHVGMLSELPIPVINDTDKIEVESLIREAFKAKDLADEKEQEAIELVEKAIAQAIN